jgi:hypothetical protein
VRRSFDAATLARRRTFPAELVLVRLATEVKPDRTFRPKKDSASRRWQVFTERGDFEILTTGPKWYDTRAGRGGGAIDLAMHLLGLGFADAELRTLLERRDREIAELRRRLDSRPAQIAR